jgi:hypothetical protein
MPAGAAVPAGGGVVVPAGAVVPEGVVAGGGRFGLVCVAVPGLRPKPMRPPEDPTCGPAGAVDGGVGVGAAAGVVPGLPGAPGVFGFFVPVPTEKLHARAEVALRKANDEMSLRM